MSSSNKAVLYPRPNRNNPRRQRQQQQPSAPPTAVAVAAVATAARRFDALPSVSRSSGLAADGDSLKDHNTQNELYAHIQQKLHTYEDNPSNIPKDASEDILRLFRKLREGILAASRKDDFAIEVYEVSLALATVAQIPAQISAALDQLQTIYKSQNISPETVHNPVYVAVLDILFDLSRSLQTQAVLNKVSKTPWKIPPDTSRWLKRLAYAAAAGNSLRFFSLTSVAGQEIDAILQGTTPKPTTHIPLRKAALLSLLHSTTQHLRAHTWDMLRFAYRETGTPWLKKTMQFIEDAELRTWLQAKEQAGEVVASPSSGWKLVRRQQNRAIKR